MATPTTTTPAMPFGPAVFGEDGVNVGDTEADKYRLLGLLQRAARQCERRKRQRPETIQFRLNEGEEMLRLAEEIQTGKYQPSAFRVFVTEKPKCREVHIAAYRDRVVHHLLYGELAPIWERRFLPCSFACRKGKGTHAAARAVQGAMWNATRHGAQRAYALQLDIRSFFGSLDKLYLLQRLGPSLNKLPALSSAPGALTWASLTERIVMSSASEGALRISPGWRFEKVPPHKRLGYHGFRYGIPIGNLTSQFFANVYLHSLDLYIKRGLGVGHYIRYVDDLVLIHTSLDKLAEVQRQIRVFLGENLSLSLHEQFSLGPVSSGVDFVGYIIRPAYLLPRKRVVSAALQAFRRGARELPLVQVKPGAGIQLKGLGELRGPFECLEFRRSWARRLCATWTSYEGHLLHASSFGLSADLERASGGARLLIGGRFGQRRVRFHGEYIGPGGLGQQRRWLASGLPPDTELFMQVGCFWELHPDRGVRFGLKPVRLRGHYRLRLGAAAARSLMQRLLRLGYGVALAFETGGAEGLLRARRLVWYLRRSFRGEENCSNSPE